MDLLNVVKTAAIQAMESSNPVSIFLGTVSAVNPISVTIEQRFTLTSEFLIVPERLTRYEIDLTHTHQYQDRYGSEETTRTTSQALHPIIIRTGLQVGDTVLLLRTQGGQKYVILDKVVDA